MNEPEVSSHLKKVATFTFFDATLAGEYFFTSSACSHNREALLDRNLLLLIAEARATQWTKELYELAQKRMLHGLVLIRVEEACPNYQVWRLLLKRSEPTAK